MRSRELAEAHGDRLRVTLALTQAPNSCISRGNTSTTRTRGRFLAVSVRTPVVRYLEIPSHRRPMLVTPPLRILGMVSSPKDIVQLDSSLERTHLEEAIAGLQRERPRRGHVARAASLDALQEELRAPSTTSSTTSDMVASIRARTRASCCSRGPTDAPAIVTGDQLGTILFDHTSLSLAVLNACEAARASTRIPSRGRLEPRSAGDPGRHRHAVPDHRQGGDPLLP